MHAEPELSSKLAGGANSDLVYKIVQLDQIPYEINLIELLLPYEY